MIEDFSGQILADKYRIDSIWRQTATGKIYRATHLLMDKPVTVKVLSPALALDAENVRRFAQEARVVSHVSHPNVLNVTDYGSDKSGVHFIVMEDAGELTLKDLLAREGNMPIERAANLARQIAAGLSAAQTQSVVHTNLTAENVLLTDENADIAKIFGFGAFEPEDSAGLEVSPADAAYYAPEQFSAATRIDERTNVYNLGVILFEMLAGDPPFVGEKPTDVMLKHEQEPPPPMSAFRRDVPDEINRVILSALAKNPDLRYQTAKEFAAALDRATPVSAIAHNARPLAADARAVEEPEQNNLWKTAFIVLAGIAVLSTFFIYTTQVKQTDPATALPTDANGQPVQPANPATGTGEQMLSNMSTYAPDAYSNSNVAGQPPQLDVLPGGDGYDPWARGGAPPPGAPNYGAPYPVQPGGQPVYVDPNSGGGSIFMPRDDGTYVMVPVNPNANANSNTQTAPRGRQTPAANANTANTAKPAPTPAANTATPAQTPAPKPTPQPRTTATPSANEKRSQSGTEQDI